MNHLAGHRARTVRAAAGIMTATMLVASFHTPAAAASTSIPSTCGGVVGHVVNGDFSEFAYQGNRFVAKGEVGPLSFDGVVETPRSMTFVRATNETAVYLAVRSSGSLWRVTQSIDSEGAQTSLISASGWGQVRHITAARTGTRLYALTTTGGLYRYSLNSDSTPRGLGPIATSGWGALKFLSAIESNAVFDLVVGVSSAGSLRQYAINRSTGGINGGSVKPTGWGQIRHISVGDCETGKGAPMVAIHDRGGAYGYYDANASDFNASDITGIGQIGHGFTGLTFD